MVQQRYNDHHINKLRVSQGPFGVLDYLFGTRSMLKVVERKRCVRGEIRLRRRSLPNKNFVEQVTVVTFILKK